MAELHNAALEGNVEEIERLLTSGENVKAKSSNGLTILFIAAHEGHWNLLLFLLLYGGESLFDDKQQVNANTAHIQYIVHVIVVLLCANNVLICQSLYAPFEFVTDLACSPRSVSCLITLIILI